MPFSVLLYKFPGVSGRLGSSPFRSTPSQISERLRTQELTHQTRCQSCSGKRTCFKWDLVRSVENWPSEVTGRALCGGLRCIFPSPKQREGHYSSKFNMHPQCQSLMHWPVGIQGSCQGHTLLLTPWQVYPSLAYLCLVTSGQHVYVLAQRTPVYCFIVSETVWTAWWICVTWPKHIQ
jgi:hypothetical protein